MAKNIERHVQTYFDLVACIDKALREDESTEIALLSQKLEDLGDRTPKLFEYIIDNYPPPHKDERTMAGYSYAKFMIDRKSKNEGNAGLEGSISFAE